MLPGIVFFARWQVTRDMAPVRVRTGKDCAKAEGGARRRWRPRNACVDVGAQDCAELATRPASPTRQSDSYASLSQWLAKNLKTGSIAAMDAMHTNKDSNGKGDKTPEPKHLEIHRTTPSIKTPTPPPPTSTTSITGGVVKVCRRFQARGGRSSSPPNRAQKDHAPLHGGFRASGGAVNGDRAPLGQWLDNLASKHRNDEMAGKRTDEGPVEGHEGLVFETRTRATRQIGIEPHGSNKQPQEQRQYQHQHQHQQQRLEGRCGDHGTPEDETSTTLEDPSDANLDLGGTATTGGGRRCSRSRHRLSAPGGDVEGGWKWEGITVNWDVIRGKAADGVFAS